MTLTCVELKIRHCLVFKSSIIKDTKSDLRQLFFFRYHERSLESNPVELVVAENGRTYINLGEVSEKSVTATVQSSEPDARRLELQ